MIALVFKSVSYQRVTVDCVFYNILSVFFLILEGRDKRKGVGRREGLRESVKDTFQKANVLRSH